MRQPEQFQYHIPNINPCELSEGNRGRFLILCQEVSDSILNAVQHHEAIQEFQRAELKIFTPSTVTTLCEFNRTIRSERKLDKSMRRFLAARDSDKYVTVYPFVEDLPVDSAYQPLLDITEPTKCYSISVIRFLEALDHRDDSIVPNKSVYRLIVEPLPGRNTDTSRNVLQVI